VLTELLPRNCPDISAHLAVVAWQRLYTLHYARYGLEKSLEGQLERKSIILASVSSRSMTKIFILS
jgi:hypothetical protein